MRYGLPDGSACASSRRLKTAVFIMSTIASVVVGQEVTGFVLPTAGMQPLAVAAGPDGNIWFTAATFDGGGPAAAVIGRSTLTGSIVEFPIPGESAGGDITAGPDGNLWFTEPWAHRVGRMTPAGQLTEFPLPAPTAFPWGITTGPDGNLWIIDAYAIHRMTSAGLVTGTFRIPTSGNEARNITAGPDGSLWFTEQATGKVGRITTQGVITEFPLAAPDRLPHEIVAGPDGALWFAQSQGPGVARMTTAGVLTEFEQDPSLSIASGPDGNIWYGGAGLGFSRMTTAGEPLGSVGPLSVVSDAVSGPDGALWVTEGGLVGRLARITTGPCTPNATSLCFAQRYRLRATWFDPHDGSSGQATAVPTSFRSGYFWFFEPNNIEVVAKVLDGCVVNERVWFFAAGMTHVAVELELLDTQTGQYRNYANVPGAPFAPIEDTGAFAVCR